MRIRSAVAAAAFVVFGGQAANIPQRRAGDGYLRGVQHEYVVGSFGSKNQRSGSSGRKAHVESRTDPCRRPSGKST